MISRGQIWDESEHAHCAWLIVRHAWVPGRDFFQHHFPLFWDILGLYFRAGGSGPEVLYFGRAIALASLLGGWALLRAAFPGNPNSKDRRWPTGTATLLLIVVIQLSVKSLLVARPESVALALYFLSVWAWCRLGSSRGFVSGVALGLAICASPRLGLLAFGHLLLPGKSADSRGHGRAFLHLCGASIVTFFAYAWISGYGLNYYSDALRFSAVAQQIGSGHPGDGAQISRLAFAFFAAAGAIFLGMPAIQRRKWGAFSLFWLGLGAATLLTAGKYHYSQAYICILSWSLVMTAYFESRISPTSKISPLGGVRRTLGRVIPAALVLAAMAGLVEAIHRNLRDDSGLAHVVRCRKQLAQLFGPDDTILATTGRHPIVVRDSSFYSVILIESNDRLGETLRAAGLRNPSQVDYASDIVSHRPVLVDDFIPFLAPPPQSQEISLILKTGYWRVGPYFLRRDQILKYSSLSNAIETCNSIN